MSETRKGEEDLRVGVLWFLFSMTCYYVLVNKKKMKKQYIDATENYITDVTNAHG